MTDDNPLPNPRKSPDSEPSLPAWMTLPGSLVQPTPPDGEDDPAQQPPAVEDEHAPVPATGASDLEADWAAPVADLDPDGPSADAEQAASVEPGGVVTTVMATVTATEDAGEAVDDPADDAVGGEAPTLRAALEAILLVVDEPVAEVTLAQVLERPTGEVAAALRGMSAEYTASGRGFDVREVAGGWRFYTRADCAPMVERFVRDGQQTRLTQAALETLAVVAYRQPVSRARVAAIRGVNSDGVMRTLVARGLVEEAGSDPESQAVLYRTSSYFLERLGLRDLSELPELAPFLPDDVENLEETTK
ncbi:segregation and condensation protein B [Nonomuraea maritima]|uniref:Segregation and condensation protein B n=2 Tax=Nonomuraea maritima TaxID=683260 RepID=A0A1G9HLD1_9ACTN|nr:segregation and condensation protein B [Nonomuraea maritima]